MANNEDASNAPENYRKEHEVVASTWRFFVSLRFIVAASAVTFHSALLTSYNQHIQQQHTALGKISILVIPLAGLVATSAVFLIEHRTIDLYLLMPRRGVELEEKLGLENTHFRKLIEPYIARPSVLRRLISHTTGIYILYTGVFAIWLVLTFFGIKILIMHP